MSISTNSTLGGMGMSEQSFYERYGCRDLSREDAISGHFTLFNGDSMVGHVLAGSLQDAYRHFVGRLKMEYPAITKITNRQVNFKGYTDTMGFIRCTVKRTVWKPKYNTLMIHGYGRR